MWATQLPLLTEAIVCAVMLFRRLRPMRDNPDEA